MRISTDKFIHDKVHKTFVADASDLPNGWIDGITMVSPRNTTAHFFLSEQATDLEGGEVESWTFMCSTNPKVAGYKLVIFND